MKRLVLRISLALFLTETVLAGPAPTTHHLAPTPKTVTWGYFDPSTPPVLRVHSGDTVEVETLPGGGIQALEEAGLPRSRVQPALLEVEREVKERGEVPHILTGPIWIEDAEPGDVLEVRMLSVELTFPTPGTASCPGEVSFPMISRTRTSS